MPQDHYVQPNSIAELNDLEKNANFHSIHLSSPLFPSIHHPSIIPSLPFIMLLKKRVNKLVDNISKLTNYKALTEVQLMSVISSKLDILAKNNPFIIAGKLTQSTSVKNDEKKSNLSFIPSISSYFLSPLFPSLCY